jgi:hypothetical protein
MRKLLRNSAVRRFLLMAVAVPVAAWALDRAARRLEQGERPSPVGRGVRTLADLLQEAGYGPLASRLRATPAAREAEAGETEEGR